MSEAPRAHLGAARLMGHSQEGVRDAESHLQKAELGADAQTLAQVGYYRARIRMGRAGIAIDPIVETLTNMWDERTENPSGSTTSDSAARSCVRSSSGASLPISTACSRSSASSSPMRERARRGLPARIEGPCEEHRAGRYPAAGRTSPAEAGEEENATDEAQKPPARQPKARAEGDEESVPAERPERTKPSRKKKAAPDLNEGPGQTKKKKKKNG